MPQITVYVRQEDLPTWKSVIKKSEFIHNALRNHSTYDGAPIVLKETLEPVTKTIKSNTIDKLTKLPGITIASEAECKGTHYMSRTFCGKLNCPWKHSNV